MGRDDEAEVGCRARLISLKGLLKLITRQRGNSVPVRHRPQQFVGRVQFDDPRTGRAKYLNGVLHACGLLQAAGCLQVVKILAAYMQQLLARESRGALSCSKNDKPLGFSRRSNDAKLYFDDAISLLEKDDGRGEARREGIFYLVRINPA